jgi:hypothetical protein
VVSLYTIQSEALSVLIACPSDDNRRFDHLGAVAQVTERLTGDTYLAQESPGWDQDSGAGITEEFTPSRPIGNRDDHHDSDLLKIGVGVIHSAAEEVYSYQNSRLVAPEQYGASADNGSVRFWCDSHPVGDYGYQYQKAITVSGRTVRIDFRLRNTGGSPFDIQTYSHNFFSWTGADARLDTRGMGRVDFAHERGEQVVQSTIDDCYSVVRPSIGPTLLVSDPSALSRNGSYHYRLSFGGKSIQETGDFSPKKFKLWVAENCLCPEVFAEVDLSPGQERRWRRQFTFSEEESC